jgi:lipoprotein-anchoring transpeptidase ErfK/SrfK
VASKHFWRLPLAAALLLLSAALPGWAERQILVNLKDRYLYVLDLDPAKFPAEIASSALVLKAQADAAKVLGKFPVAIGAPESPTPTGFYSILEKIKDPTYYSHSKNALLPPGPCNPVGNRWMTFKGADDNAYGIHGTAWPEWVERREAVSKGCIRMLNADAVKVFDLVKLGTPVRITRD